MRLELSVKNYPGVLIAVLVALGVWSLSVGGMLRLPQGWLYDAASRLGSAPAPAQPRLLLIGVEADASNRGAETWLKLLDELARLDAGRIAFSFFPPGADARFYQKAQKNHVVFARPLVFQGGVGESLQPWPGAAEGLDLPFGVALTPGTRDGVYRRAQRSVVVGSQTLPSFVSVAAAQEIGADPPTSFLIAFNPAPLPQVALRRVLEGGLIEELVSGRVVMIGRSRAADEPGLFTPLGASGRRYSLLEYRAHGVSTLLEGSAVREFGPGMRLLILVLMTSASLVLYHWTTLRASLWVSAALILGYFVLGVLSLRGFALHLPLAEMMMGQLLVFALVGRQRIVQEDGALRGMLAETSARLRRRLFPPDFYDTPGHWAQLITFVDQNLDLKRLLFLERVEGDNRVKEIKALRCALEDIDERRRDYHRTPYSTAIAEGGPISVGSGYLKRSSEAEEQYLVPLTYAGDVLGFWAFGVDPGVVQGNRHFETTVREFAGQIGELLFHRRQWHRTQQREGRYLMRLARLESGELVYRDVRESVQLLEKRLDVLEGVFDGVHLATVLYDLFGRIIQVNREMSDLLKAAGWPVYDMTALDLLTRISAMEEGALREVIRKVVVENRHISLPVTLEHMTGRDYVLHLRALERPDPLPGEGAGAAPFRLMGLLFELVDVTALKMACRLKDLLVERLNYQIRNDMESVLIDVSILGEDELQASVRKDTVGLVKRKMEALGAIMQEVSEHLGKDTDISMFQAYPVDGRKPLLGVLDELAPALKAKQVRLEAQLPELMSLVLSKQDELRFVLKAMLGVLLSDAASDTTLKIHVQEQDTRVEYRFSNTGFGIPDERFQAYLFEEQSQAAEAYRDLREAVELIRSWGGEIEAHSEIGTGMRMWMRLRAFI